MATAPTPSQTPIGDPVLETQLFWDRYKTAILASAAVLILALAAYGGYRLYEARQDAAAAAMLAGAQDAANFQKIIDEYPGSDAAPAAYLLLAGKYRDEQKYAEANSTLQKFIDKHAKHQLVTTAKMALAANLESLRKVDEALDVYRRVAAENPTSFNAPLALLAQVPLLKGKGQVDEARRVCETILSQYRESAAAGEATRQLRLLKPATPPTPAAADAPASNAPANAPGAARAENAAPAPPAAADSPASAPPAAETPAATTAPTP